MEKLGQRSVNILGKWLKYEISERGVHLYCDQSFYELMEVHPVLGVELVVIAMKRDYKFINERALKIHSLSLEIEIWGHYFFEVLFVQLEPLLLKLNWESIRKRLSQATDIIDCAEWKYDNNRWLWDMMIPLHPMIRRMIK